MVRNWLAEHGNPCLLYTSAEKADAAKESVAQANSALINNLETLKKSATAVSYTHLFFRPDCNARHAGDLSGGRQ